MAFLRAFLQSPSGIFGLVAVLILTAIAVVAPIVLQDPATTLVMAQSNLKPSPEHPFGTDSLGRDVLARMFVATRLSLGMGVVAELVAFAIGVPFGAAVALMGVRTRSVAMRVIDTMIAFPGLLVTIVLLTVLGPAFGLWGLAVGIAIPSSFRLARVVSTLALSIGGRDYLNAARVLGVRGPRLLFRYILPNIAEVLLISLAVGVSGTVLALAGLSFLGLGVQAPDFDWGALLTEGVNSFYVSPLSALGPMVFIAATAAAFAFLGEALARAANPVVWTSARRRDPMEEAVARRDAQRRRRREEAVQTLVAHGVTAAQGRGPVLQVDDLGVQFPGAGVPVRILADVSFAVREGERVGIVGESGSGKTMTMLALAGLVPYPGEVTGTVTLLGRDLEAMREADLATFLGTEMAFVFQDPNSSLNPAMTIGAQLTEATQEHRHYDKRRARQLAIDRLVEVNLPTPERQLERHPHELSGGMRQRVMIAMGLMNEPKLLICDEPTTALDVTVQSQIMDLLAKVNERHRASIILIAHNLALVRQNCDRILVMYAGRIVEDLPSGRLTIDPLHPYTRALLQAVPDVSREPGQPFATIPGQAPDFAALPTGCAFHPRCPLAIARCSEELPPLVERPDGRRVACWVANSDEVKVEPLLVTA